MKNNKINYNGRKYDVVPHNPKWAVTFEKESQELKKYLVVMPLKLNTSEARLFPI